MCVWPGCHPQGVRSGSSLAKMSDGQRGRVPIEGQSGAGRRRARPGGLFCGVGPVTDGTGGLGLHLITSLPVQHRPELCAHLGAFFLLTILVLVTGCRPGGLYFSLVPHIHNHYLECLVKYPFTSPSPRSKYILWEHNQVKQGGVDLLLMGLL